MLGSLFGFKNPLGGAFSSVFGSQTFNPFKKIKLPNVDDPKYLVGGVWREDLYNQDMQEYETQSSKLSQFQEAAMGLGKEPDYKTPSMLNVGMSRPAMQTIEESPYGAPLNIELPGGNVPPGPSTPGTFSSMKNLMERADLLNQLKKKRVL